MSAPAASNPPVADARACFTAWRRHRGNFRRDNEDSVVVEALGAPAVAADGDAATMALSSGERGFVALVCDGVGGGTAGEVASALAARTFADRLATVVPAAAAGLAAANDDARVIWVRQAVQYAHHEILAAVARDRALEGMGTTLTAAWLWGRYLHCAQVGDSRLYRLRTGRLEQISQDQSFVGRLRRQGELTEREARHHPLRNIVDQVIGGTAKDVQPEVHVHTTAPGDEWLLCSDGLNDALSDFVIERELVRRLREPAELVVQALLEMVLDAAGRDNVSIVLVRVGRERASGAASLLARARRAWRTYRAVDVSRSPAVTAAASPPEARPPADET